MTVNHPDTLILAALLFIGVGIFWLYPDAAPYFVLVIGAILFTLWALVVMMGVRRKK
jgi:hypothetical protein